MRRATCSSTVVRRAMVKRVTGAVTISVLVVKETELRPRSSVPFWQFTVAPLRRTEFTVQPLGSWPGLTLSSSCSPCGGQSRPEVKTRSLGMGGTGEPDQGDEDESARHSEYCDAVQHGGPPASAASFQVSSFTVQVELVTSCPCKSRRI